MRTILTIIVLMLIIGGGVFAYQTYDDNVSYRNPKSQGFKVAKGLSVRKISHSLSERKIIHNPYFFELYVRAFEAKKSLKAGEYEIPKGADYIVVAEILLEGKTKKRFFTIAEGLNLKQICQQLKKQKVMEKTRCEELVQRTDLLGLDIPTKNLEGYLFPETYSFESETTPEQIISMMIDLFKKKVLSVYQNAENKDKLTLHQVVTLASIIEKETAQPIERPLISSVFHNRLEKGMLLQTDPTVIYGIKNFDGNITRKHLKTDHPYNTYTRAGLPPGPISSPSLAAIEAALIPVASKMFYFVAKGQGYHYFSENLDRHNHAVRYFQLKRGAPPPEQDLESLLQNSNLSKEPSL